MEREWLSAFCVQQTKRAVKNTAAFLALSFSSVEFVVNTYFSLNDVYIFSECKAKEKKHDSIGHGSDDGTQYGLCVDTSTAHKRTATTTLLFLPVNGDCRSETRIQKRVMRV